MADPLSDRRLPPRWVAFAVLLGLFLTLRGYRSLEGDQAYRLPLLMHRNDPALFARDPFVRAFDVFNPHRGYLALIDAAGLPLGLPTGLAVLFGLTFALASLGLGHLARRVWPQSGPSVGVAAVGMVLIAQAGNIGTNHLFEPMLLDRQIALALGWVALALAIGSPRRAVGGASTLIGLAALVHPSMGLQLGMLLAGGWIVWGLSGGVPGRMAVAGVAAVGLALVPAAYAMRWQASVLLDGLPAEEMRLLSAFLQSPQHMVPHLWRKPQWIAWSCYPLLAGLALLDGRREPDDPTGESGGRVRLAALLGVNLAALAAAWVAVEGFEDLRATLFQPFRMATVARGLCLVALAGRVVRLWRSGRGMGRVRSALIVAGLSGDWAMVVATAVEIMGSLAEALGPGRDRRNATVVLATLAVGLWFLARHDTESGFIPMLAALGGTAVAGLVESRRPIAWDRPRALRMLAAVWVIPVSAAVAGLTLDPEQVGRSWWAGPLVRHCRFASVPVEDMERLALWCRDHTPVSARFVGPPGPKTFRLWSSRSLAFNRAGSPYHAEGLADWASRFRDHVGFRGPTGAFALAYLRDRQTLERRYDAMTPADLADLARRQGAEYVLAAPPDDQHPAGPGPLELLHVEGRYAAYRVRPDAQTQARAQARAGTERSAGTG